jgi:ribonuclease G
MRREIIVNHDPNETRIAILEDKQLVELLVERPDERRIVGDIYKGRVNAVLPGMQAAFIDLGLARTAFLHASDLAEGIFTEVDDLDDDLGIDDEEDDEEESDEGAAGPPPGRGRGNGGGRPRGRRGRGRASRGPLPKIEERLVKGQEVIVQVTKEAISTKGPRVTQQLSIPGRFLVLMPGSKHIGVSRKIDSREERSRLRRLLEENRPPDMGLIVRTAGEGKTSQDFKNDVRYLLDLWRKIDNRASRAEPPALLHREMSLTTGLIRDILTEDVSEVLIDDARVLAEVQEYVKSLSPELADRVKPYRGPKAIFDQYEVEGEIERLLERKVWMKKGGHLIVDQTEALIAIDVNTGRFVGKKNQEETILKTNLEAAREVARQLRLRDVGGIIVIDFIDMESEANKKQVLDQLRQALKRDRSRTKTTSISDLGLVEMTRERERQSLLDILSVECPHCGGLGKVLSLNSLALKVERLLRRIGQAGREKVLELRVSPELADHLFQDQGARIERLEKQYGYRVDIRDDPRLAREEVRVFYPRTGEDMTEKFKV